MFWKKKFKQLFNFKYISDTFLIVEQDFSREISAGIVANCFSTKWNNVRIYAYNKQHFPFKLITIWAAQLNCNECITTLYRISILADFYIQSRDDG